MEDAFSEFPKLELNARKNELFLNGVMLTYELEDGVYNIYSEGKYIGLGRVKKQIIKERYNRSLINVKFTKNSL